MKNWPILRAVVRRHLLGSFKREHRENEQYPNSISGISLTPLIELQSFARTQLLEKPKHRHSREGGNPSPELDFITQTGSVWIARVMDSRLRGNDEVGGFEIRSEYQKSLWLDQIFFASTLCIIGL